MRRLILGFVVLTSTFAAPALAQTAPATPAPQEAARQDDFVQTFFLTNAVAVEVQQVLAQLVATSPGQRPVITVSRSSNSLTIRGTKAALQMLTDVIKQLDVPATVTSAPTAPAASTPAAQGQAPAAPRQNRLPSLPPLPSTTNIQLELTITDTISGSPVTKTVSMVILNGSDGQIRTASSGGSEHILNVDAVANAYQNGLIGVRVTFYFQPPAASVEGKPGQRAPSLNESLTVVVSDGKPMVVSQSADASSDRKVTATIKATVLK
jgi:hypothetical protein